MDKKISNKIVQIKDIIHMAEIISLHNRYYVELEQAEKQFPNDFKITTK